MSLRNYVEAPIIQRRDFTDEAFQRKYSDLLDVLQAQEEQILGLTKEEEVAEEIDAEIMKVRHYKLATKIAQVCKDFKGDTVDISQNKIGHLFILENKGLLGEMVKLVKLRILDLSFNVIDDKGVALLSQICGTIEGLIPKDLPLKELRLRHNRLTNASHLGLSPFFRHLDVLDLSENPLTDSFIRELFISLPSDTITFTISNLSMQSCGLSNLSVHLLQQHLSVFPSLKTFDFTQNENLDEQALELFHSQLLQRAYSSYFKHQQGLMPSPNPSWAQSELPFIQEYMPKDLLLNGLNDLQSLLFIVKQTGWWLSRGILTFREDAVKSLFPNDKKIIPRVMALWCNTIEKVKHGSKAQGGIDLMSMLPLEVLTAQHTLIDTFRDSVMSENVTYFDISGNQLDQLTLSRVWSELVPLCSHRLKVLILDDNLMHEKSLSKLLSTLDRCGFQSLTHLSLSHCGLSCSCQAPSDSCPLSSFFTFLSNHQPLLANLNLSRNPGLQLSHLVSLSSDSILSLDLRGSGPLAQAQVDTAIIDQVIQWVEKQLPRVQECQVLDAEIDFNPIVRQRLQRELGKVINQRSSSVGRQNEFERRYMVVEEQPLKEAKEICFFTTVMDGEEHRLVRMGLELETMNKICIIPSQAADQDACNHKFYLKLLGQSFRSSTAPQDCYNLYEPFEHSLLDYLLHPATHRRPVFNLSKVQLAHLVLDFYDSLPNSYPCLILPQTLVIQITANSGLQRVSYSLKALPIPSMLHFPYKQYLLGETQEADLQHALDTFNQSLGMFQSKKLALSHTFGIWRHVLSPQACRNGPVYEEHAGKLRSGMLGLETWVNRANLQRTVFIMTIVDLIFGQKPLFKRVHTENLARERQVDKYFMRLFIKIVEEARASGDNMGDAQRVYMRVSQLLS